MGSSRWKDLKSRLRNELEPDEFATWFSPLRLRSEDAKKLILLAPNERFIATLEKSYRTKVDRAMADLEDQSYQVLFSLEENLDADMGVPPSTTFNPRYDFGSFVVGNSNQFAHAAARAVADNPARSYNPLFLYGGVGLGKTHLMHAIGHHAKQRHPNLQVMYLPAEQFVNDLISSLRFSRMPNFRETYRNIDLLLIDDIQFLANKERTQEEFFHTFNTLYAAEKQIILSSDCSPRNIPDIEERLRSRFEWGLIADIQPPDLETKTAILRRKADLEQTTLPNDVALFIAKQVKSNIRELEGHLNRVVAFASLTGEPLTLELAKDTLKDILPPEDHRVTASEIIKLVARHYGLKIAEIKSKNNSKQIAFPRQVAMYMVKKVTDLSYPEIGKLFNNKHHSTVMYSVDKIEKMREGDDDFDRTLRQLERNFPHAN